MNPESAQPVVFLVGPTASGKTGLAVALTEALPLDIISVDSAMVYRGMDIGTAKPDAATLARAPHRLIDIRDPAVAYSAAEFARDAGLAMAAIHAAGRIPLLVGGTGLYFRALEQGLSPLPAADPEVRARLSAQAAAGGWPILHRRLAAADAASAARIHPQDGQRIQRALEILELTGASPSAHYARAKRGGRCRGWWPIKVAVAPGARDDLHRRIARRFDQMLAAGFLQEVEKLHARPDLMLTTPALRAVGYRQLWRYLDGDWDYPEAARRALSATRQLAKRQLTWWRAASALERFDSNNPALADEVIFYIKGALGGPPPC